MIIVNTSMPFSCHDCIIRSGSWCGITEDKTPDKGRCKNCPIISEFSSHDLTNGDVVKAMFPHMNFVEDPEETGDDFGRVIYMVNDNYTICFDSDWWNAPYKEGDIKS